MLRAFQGWIGRHPDDGRYILNNGYDWCYFTVEDTPFFVTALVGATSDSPLIELSDGTREPFDPTRLEVRRSGALVVRVKGNFRARFTRSAQLSLEPLLECADDGCIWIRAGKIRWMVPDSAPGEPGE